MDEKRIEILVEQFKSEFKKDIEKIINSSNIEEKMETIKDQIYKMYERFLESSIPEKRMPLDTLIIGKSNIANYLQREYENIREEKVDIIMKKVNSFENSRENKCQWNNAEKRKEDFILEAEYKDSRLYNMKVNAWLEKIQSDLNEIERQYKIACQMGDNIVVSLFNQEVITVLHQNLEWDKFQSRIVESMLITDDKTMEMILIRYEEYRQLVEKVSKDIDLQDEYSRRSKRELFTEEIRVNNEKVNVQDAIQRTEEKLKEKVNDGKQLSADFIV